MSNFNIYLNINETNNIQNINIYLNTNSLNNNINDKINVDIINNSNNEIQEQISMSNNDINIHEEVIINNNDININIHEEVITDENNIKPLQELTNIPQYIYVEPSAPPLLDNICYEVKKESYSKIDKKCTHYNNNIMIYANCCNKYFDCYKCHNEKSNHRIFSYNLTHIKCLSCNHDNKFGINIKSNSCVNCKTPFSKYNCKICCVWDNRMSYHCHKCDVCKYGNKNDCFHCDNCNMCIKNSAKNRHKCHLTNKDDDCSICLEKLFPKKNNEDKDNQITFLNCGHVLHFNCYNKMISLNKRNCPLCRTKF